MVYTPASKRPVIPLTPTAVAVGFLTTVLVDGHSGDDQGPAVFVDVSGWTNLRRPLYGNVAFRLSPPA